MSAEMSNIGKIINKKSMAEIIGTVKNIEVENDNGRDKTIVSLSLIDNIDQVLFVEFQGGDHPIDNSIEHFDMVKVKFYFKGKVSQFKKKYNNLVGIRITKIS